MNLDQIKYFVAVAETGLLHAAAVRVGVSQPALTKSLSRMEAELGFALFERHSKGMRLTAYGAAFVADAKLLQRIYEDSLNRLGELRAGDLATVRVGATPATASFIDAAFLSLLKSRPALRLDLRVELSDALINALIAGEIDIAVAPMPDDLPDEIAGRPLFEETAWVVCRAKHPILKGGRQVRPEDLARYSWVLPKTTVFARRQVDDFFRQHGLAGPNLQLERGLSTSPDVFSLLASSDFLGISSTRFQALAAQFGVREVPAEGARWPRLIGLLRRSQGRLSPLAQTFIEHIVDCVTAPP
jgi:DNA-binding transcriptional LysR family regulator